MGEPVEVTVKMDPEQMARAVAKVAAEMCVKESLLPAPPHDKFLVDGLLNGFMKVLCACGQSTQVRSFVTGDEIFEWMAAHALEASNG